MKRVLSVKWKKTIRDLEEGKKERKKYSMEGFQKAIRKEPSATATNLSLNSGSYSASPSDPPSLLLTRNPRRAVSLLTCSKLCGIFFVAGIIVGYTLKRRVRRWASRLLRRIKDD